MALSKSDGRCDVLFVVSQPRAGSTLLQTMLAGHPKVTAPGETWLMLPLIYAVGGPRSAQDAPYCGKLADQAIECFAAEHLDRGVSSIQREIGVAAMKVYQSVRERTGADVLVDKTPRYYWIIDELLHFMPTCRIILLVRNPLAVLSSILSTWATNSVGNLSSYRADLLEAPARIANAMQYDDSRVKTIHYEELVRDTEQTLCGLQQFMGLDVVNGLGNYGLAPKRRFGDPVGIHDHTSPILDSVDKWVSHASQSPVVWKLLSDYRYVLGDDLLGRLGYSGEKLAAQLQSVKPAGTGIAPSLQSQLRKKPIEPVRSVFRLRNACALTISKLGRRAA